MSLFLAAAVFGAGIAAAWATSRLLKRRTPAEPRRPVGDRYVAAPGFPQPADAEPTRAEHVEAVRALCTASPLYVHTRLAAYEAEVSGVAELLLELDDRSARPDDGDLRGVAE